MTRSSKAIKRVLPYDPTVPPRAVIYTRISDAGGDHLTNHASQEASARRRVETLGGTVVLVEHDNQPGDQTNRPGLWRAIQQIEDGNANLLVVHAFDRLARNAALSGTLVHTVRSNGGEIMSATEEFDSGPFGDLHRTIAATIAEVEKEKTRERVNRSLDALFVQQRKYKPGGRVPYGYLKHGRGGDAVYTAHPEHAAVVRRIFELLAQGVSQRQVALLLQREGVPPPTARAQIWHISMINKMLDREVYWTGLMPCWVTKTARTADQTPFDVKTEPEDQYLAEGFVALVEPELAARAREASERNKLRTARSDRDQDVGILRYGFVYCATCGRRLHVQNGSRRRRQPLYQCRKADTLSPCSAESTIQVPTLDAPVWWWVQDALWSYGAAARYVVTQPKGEVDPELLVQLRGLETRVDTCEREISGLMANLAHLPPAAGQRVGQRIEELIAEQTGIIAERDRCLGSIEAAKRTPRPELQPEEAVARMGLVVLDAMWSAHRAQAEKKGIDPDLDVKPVQTVLSSDLVKLSEFAIETWFRDRHYVRDAKLSRETRGEYDVTVAVPQSWAAKQAALGVLGVRVEVTKSTPEDPKWKASMTLPGSPLTQVSSDRESYTITTPRC